MEDTAMTFQLTNSNKTLIFTLPGEVDPWKTISFTASSYNATQQPAYAITDMDMTPVMNAYKRLLTGESSTDIGALTLTFSWNYPTSQNVDYSGSCWFSADGMYVNQQPPGISIYLVNERSFRLEIQGQLNSLANSGGYSNQGSFSTALSFRVTYLGGVV